MGNDGGTFVRRSDIVRVRDDGGKANVDPAILARVLATTCALSRQPLRTPIVSDALGRLYNKDSVVKHLLRRAEAAAQHNGQTQKQDLAVSHLRGLKDVQTLSLTPNPAYKTVGTTSEDEVEGPAPFMCPLHQREMNGRHRFVYIRRCGCVMSESGLRATCVEDASHRKSKTSPTGDDETASVEEKASCPVCGTLFSTACMDKKDILPGGDVIVLNGTEEEVAAMREVMEQGRSAEHARRKLAKQAKAAAKDGSEGRTDVKEREQRREDKRKHRDEAQRMLDGQPARDEGAKRVKVQHDVVLTSRAKNADVVAEKGTEMSAAMRSIYGLDKPKGQDTWMTRGTFNRFA